MVRHTGANTATAMQLATRMRNCVSKEWLDSRTSHIVSPLFIDLMDAIGPGQVLHYTTEGFISCHARVKLDNVLQREGVTSWLILGVIQFTASRPQAAAQGTPKMAKTKIQGQRQSLSHCTANNIKLPEWQWVAPASQHVHPKLRVYCWGDAPLVTSTSPCMPRQAVLQLSLWWLGALMPRIWECRQLCAQCFWWIEGWEPPITVINIFSHSPKTKTIAHLVLCTHGSMLLPSSSPVYQSWANTEASGESQGVLQASSWPQPHLPLMLEANPTASPSIPWNCPSSLQKKSRLIVSSSPSICQWKGIRSITSSMMWTCTSQISSDTWGQRHLVCQDCAQQSHEAESHKAGHSSVGAPVTKLVCPWHMLGKHLCWARRHKCAEKKRCHVASQ